MDIGIVEYALRGCQHWPAVYWAASILTAKKQWPSLGMRSHTLKEGESVADAI